MKITENTQKWILLFVLALTWGSSFFLIKKGVEYFQPMQVGALRIAIAGILLLPFGLYNLKSIPKKTLPWLLLSGFLSNFVPMFLFPMAEVKISSSLAGILNSLVPIFVVIIGHFVFHIKSNATQIAGTILGFVGAFVLIYFSEKQIIAKESNHDLLHIGYILLATICYATAGLITKKHLSNIPSFRLSTVVFTVLFFPAAILLIYNDFYGDFITLNQTENAFNGLAYVAILAVFGTALAMIIFYKLIQISSTVFAASVTYLMPFVAIFWGMFDNEPLQLIHVIGMSIILLGVYLIQYKKKEEVL
ncbi:MAG: EamA family transporter [Flavobacteriaceae bacterium]|nr:MAG: EamA family transporter [Flavobacteriaceae bacterium]